MASLLKDTEPSTLHSLLSPATVPEESLYKSDPARKSKSGKTSFTRQADIEEVRSSYVNTPTEIETSKIFLKIFFILIQLFVFKDIFN